MTYHSVISMMIPSKTLASTSNIYSTISKMQRQQSTDSSSKSFKQRKTKMKTRDRKDPTQFWNTAKRNRKRLRLRVLVEICLLDNEVRSSKILSKTFRKCTLKWCSDKLKNSSNNLTCQDSKQKFKVISKRYSSLKKKILRMHAK